MLEIHDHLTSLTSYAPDGLLSLAFLMLTVVIPSQNSPGRQQVQVLLWSSVLFIMFSVLISLFRVKNRGVSLDSSHPTLVLRVGQDIRSLYSSKISGYVLPRTIVTHLRTCRYSQMDGITAARLLSEHTRCVSFQRHWCVEHYRNRYQVAPVRYVYESAVQF